MNNTKAMITMKKLFLTALLMLCMYNFSRAQRYIDHELKVLYPSEQFTYVKGYYSDTIQLIYTNLGPDTLFSQADSLILTLRNTVSPSYPKFHRWSFSPAYNIAPGQSSILKFHFDLEQAVDNDRLSVSFSINRYTPSGKGVGTGGTIMPEKQEDWANSGVIIYFHYRSATSSTESDESIPSLSIYPNPVNEVLHLSAENLTGETTFEIFGLNGQRLLHGSLGEEISIHVNHLPKGIYFIQCRNEHEWFNGRFVKN